MKRSTLKPTYYCKLPYNCTGFIIENGKRSWLTKGIDKVWRRVRAKGHAEELEELLKKGEV